MRKLHWVAIVGIFALSSVLVTQSVSARETLIPLTECPKVEQYNECLVSGLSLRGGKTQNTIRREIGRDTITKTYLIEGSLAGGETKPYALRFVQPLTDYFASTNHSGPLAHLESVEGSPLVFTDRGQLLILSDSVRIEDPPNIVVVDEQRKEVLARYYHPCIDLSFLSTATNAIWDEGGRRCLAINFTNTPSTKHHERACSPPAKNACDGVPADFVPATGMTLKRLEELVREFRTLRLQPSGADGTFFGGSGWGVWPYRVPNTPLLVFYGYCGDCDIDPFARDE